ncbi:hypothetical protein A2962_01770 [Candidatus Woesebacteria bacterium RIFCSPLOWO2_01_FULL_39_61]|uniref:Uncharacterized protein n=1 Tax=Candidatus Woesebacteria bacterium RIFCSPHIGHO2_02_FULL_39_13 TaxID=1802505 RepID=A0A1F7Z2F3_9BACT|nr:MAG: hypothetical protein A2692_02770 [Candidatus Woesebacteria bacterium RIFCSPHIGHO2_01_FULL_39_95]OGM33717.1 MAG: hypothetical protein A3D01_06270 [Candidatus Woesebacteria bacterium RIFCSPHIGHO2_02_FULL_39_13]OGM38393.1 MAG: hypothetical protein A3E13_01955 [Candidatus Woesebacteria bacterium RIFCSPHIGHO2_12_FULL_40_20]OGM66760.1 MAG: hypothetical protein A2962_01770 [Candidatus Woesebacteria bacterium RIFCSPLOWO2_01_FULL_39_61]OGM74743.1 MAG: hypothetical protein A3H19_00175 [Candidatus
MAQSAVERYNNGVFEIVVNYDPQGSWTWKITILKNGVELDQLRSSDTPSYLVIGDLFRYNNVPGLSARAVDLVYQIKERVPYELG